MTDILFTANGASATALVSGELTSGMVGLPVRFSFDSDWDGLNIVAVFDGGGQRISVPLLTDMEAVLPWEVIAKANTRLRIGAEGRKSDGSIVIPTVWANAGYITEGAVATDEEGNPPTPGIYDQIMAAIEAGKLKGEKGDKGDPGEQGPVGPAGPQGEKGEKGDKGDSPIIVDDLYTQDITKALSARQGAILREKIDDDVLAAKNDLEAKVKERVKTVNGVAPDENGNVNVEGGSGGGSGEPGADGFSPIANVTQTGSGAVISITDKSGTTTANVFNGKDGKDGYTPVKGVDYFDGAPGKDGVDGKDGAQGIQGEQGPKGDTGAPGADGAKGDKGDKGDTGAQGEPGKDGADGAPGANGKDGVSATHSWNGTTLTITSASGTSSANLKGEKGDKGDQGIQGIQGEPGAKGDTGAKGDKGDKGDTGATGAAGKNGADGYTPVRGTDYWTEADKVEIVQRVIETLGGNPIFGIVDENNNIIVSGDLPDGTYSVKYEMENGTKLNIGNLVIDTNVYYTVTNTLTQCTTNNSATKAVQGGSYSATITAKSGYELKSIVVKMGGTDISSTAVSGGTITIASVTGNIVITAVAEEVVVEIINQLPISTDASGNPYVGTNGEKGYKVGYRIKSSTGAESAASGIHCTGFIPVTRYQTVRINGITLHSTTGYNAICFYDASKVYLGGTDFTNALVTVTDGVYSFTPSTMVDNLANCAFVRFSCGSITANTIVTVDQEIV